MPSHDTSELVSSSELTHLQLRVAREIVALVRRENRKAGEHLPEVLVAQHIGTSRSPVQAALRHLARLGVLAQDANRGYFLAKDAKAWGDEVAGLLSSEDPVYVQIADDVLKKRLPQEVNEADLMRRYGVARSSLRKVLSRISEEGWIEQNVGHGWRFLPMIDSLESYEESYLFRQYLEPNSMLGATFSYQRPALLSLRAEQQHIVDGGFEEMTAIELFEANSRFHETLAEWGGNRFVLQSVRRINQLRRLLEYRQATVRRPRRDQSLEHLAILEAIEQMDMVRAAALMRSHLDGARRDKLKQAQNI